MLEKHGSAMKAAVETPEAATGKIPSRFNGACLYLLNMDRM